MVKSQRLALRSYLKVYPTPNFNSGLPSTPTFTSKKRPSRFLAPPRKLKPASASEPPLSGLYQLMAGPPPTYRFHGWQLGKRVREFEVSRYRRAVAYADIDARPESQAIDE